MASTQAIPAGRAAAGPKAHHILAVVTGNGLAFYDFLSYAFFAPQIGRALFPAGAPGAQLLASLAAFGVGFFMRPVGALVIGRMADRRGRRPAMLITFMILGIAMGGLALTPSYARIGVFAPALAVFFRLLQGFGVGGELGASNAYLLEAAPPGRRGLTVSLGYMGQDVAALIATGLGLLLSLRLTAHQLDAWGWRAVFLLGVVIVPAGLVLRSRLPETLNAPEPEALPIPARLPGARTMIFLGFVLIGCGSLVSYVLNYFTTYATETLHMAQSLGFAGQWAVSVGSVIGDPLGGWAADRLGRKPVMIVMTLATVLLALPAYALIDAHRTAVVLIGFAFALGLIYNVGSSAVLVAITEAMPKHLRSVGVGLAYALGVATLGGTAQFVVAWLTQATHNILAPAIYLTAGAVVILVAILALPETAPGKLRPRI